MDTNNPLSQDFDIYKLISLVLKRKLLVCTIVIFSILISAFIALNISNKYESSATLYVNEPINQNSSAGFGGIAAIVGIGTSGGSSKGDLAREILYSRAFLNNLIQKEDFLLNIFASKSYDSSINSTIYDSKIYDVGKRKWVAYNNEGIQGPPTMLQVQKKYNEIITFNEDKTSGFIKISATHHSPIFVHELLQYIIEELNRTSSLSAIKDSQESLVFLEDKLAITKQIDLRESLLKLIASQLEKEMMASVQSQYLLKILDKPFIPEKKVSPNRSVIVIFSALIGLIFSIFYILIADIASTRTKSNY